MKHNEYRRQNKLYEWSLYNKNKFEKKFQLGTPSTPKSHCMQGFFYSIDYLRSYNNINLKDYLNVI